MGATGRAGLWPGRPRLLPNESFSSWFGRLAAANGLQPRELFRAALPGTYLFAPDMDRAPPLDLLSSLTQRTGIDAGTLRRATFDRWAGRLFDNDDGRRKLHWAPPAGTRAHARSFGQQFCPRCLAEDTAPYFRMAWRLSFVTGCERHGILLADRCPGCHEPIHPLRITRGKHSVRCHKCSLDLCSVVTGKLTDAEFAIQRRFLGIRDEDWANIGNWGPIHSLSFFWLAAVLCRVIVGNRRAQPLRAWLAAKINDGREILHVPMLREVELLTPVRRLAVLRAVHFLLEEWPTGFLEGCHRMGVVPGGLIQYPTEVPFAFVAPVIGDLSRSTRRFTDAEFAAGVDFIRRRGKAPTYGALVELLSVKVDHHRHMLDPVGRVSGLNYRSLNHPLDQFRAIEEFPVKDYFAERVVDNPLPHLVHMDMDPKLLRTNRSPDGCWRRRPDGVGAADVVVEVDRPRRRLISQILGKPVVERLQRRRDDRSHAPGTVATAITAKMFAVRGPKKSPRSCG